MATKTAPRMEWTGNPDADALVARDPLALLIGFCLDQQIPVEKAFLGPLDIQRRLGTLDARELAAIDPGQFEAAFRQRPAIHRFPASMAGRVQALCATVAGDYGGDASAIWRGVTDAKELQRRLRALPGFGEMKARIVLGVLAKHLGVTPAGWKELAPDFPTLADVQTVAEREQYQAGKRAYKAAMRAQADARSGEAEPVG
ncbi:MAG: Fe-S cluster assembly protein HesB [Candidatus Dormibacteraeota bacterium]|nr:Fe-S cluster assembly protein HesB [Candidatus Dormibacteraeota bacterium]